LDILGLTLGKVPVPGKWAAYLAAIDSLNPAALGI